MFGRATLQRMLASHEIESLRRSHAMAPLSPTQVSQLIDTCAQLSRQREQVATVLARLPESFADLRAALNELHRIVSSANSPAVTSDGRGPS